MRIMGLDIGHKRIGVAMSDVTELIAQNLITLKRKDLSYDLKILKDLIEKKQVGLIIVGLPLNMNGSVSKKAHEILEFIEILKHKFELPIETYDERLSSKEAESILIKGDVSRRKRKDKIDKIAAQLVLQNYLDSRERKV